MDVIVQINCTDVNECCEEKGDTLQTKKNKKREMVGFL